MTDTSSRTANARTLGPQQPLVARDGRRGRTGYRRRRAHPCAMRISVSLPQLAVPVPVREVDHEAEQPSRRAAGTSSRPAARTSASGTTGCRGSGRPGRAARGTAASASGFVRRMISTAAQTITKANSVPMLVRWSSASIGRKPVRTADEHADQDRRLPRRAELRVDVAEEARRHHPVAGHRQEHPRRREHQHEQHRRDAGHAGRRDDELGPRQARLLEGVGHAGIDAQLVVASPSR